MNKTLEIAIILSAVDRASRVMNDVFQKQNDKLRELQDKSAKLLSGGTQMMGAGVALGASLAPAVAAADIIPFTATAIVTVLAPAVLSI